MSKVGTAKEAGPLQVTCVTITLVSLGKKMFVNKGEKEIKYQSTAGSAFMFVMMSV